MIVAADILGKPPDALCDQGIYAIQRTATASCLLVSSAMRAAARWRSSAVRKCRSSVVIVARSKRFRDSVGVLGPPHLGLLPFLVGLCFKDRGLSHILHHTPQNLGRGGVGWVGWGGEVRLRDGIKRGGALIEEGI